MLYAVKIAFDRQAQAKMTSFVIRGRFVTVKEVQHYFRRKGVRDLKALMKDADPVEPTTRIECHTPQPTAIAVDEEDRNVSHITVASGSLESQVRQASSGIMVIPDPNQMARVLQQPPELEQPD